jgi:hypothetical protein
MKWYRQARPKDFDSRPPVTGSQRGQSKSLGRLTAADLRGLAAKSIHAALFRNLIGSISPRST